jgi:hypothetical protein
MTRTEARALKDEIGNFCHCVHKKSLGGYFVRIFSARGIASGAAVAVDFHSRDEWLAWKQKADAEDSQRKAASRPRSPIEMMIDLACGLK